jgi:microcin C transport system substrate-binding protein
MRGSLLLLAACFSGLAAAAPGYSVWGDFKYAPGFDHFAYVNPDAPKGGEIRLVPGSRVSNFDKYNPYTLKGREPSFLGDLLFESLLTGAMDEIGVGYGLLAEDVEVAPDRLSATFRLRKEARFHNGDPVLAADVKHSYDTLVSKYAAPTYATLLVDVAGCDVIDERTVRFRFKKADRQLPLIVGGLPIFSRKWGAGKPFDQVVLDIPIATGPYRIGPVRFGKDITYVRDPNYWARDLPVRRGQNNFDRITVKIYRDNTAQLEALKAGEFDLMEIFSAGDWARRMTGPRFDKGELVKQLFQHRRPDGFPSYFLNLRLPKFQDRRVRVALDLALDYEWMNRSLFRGAYTRVNGVFGNTDCQAKGTPTPGELALLEPHRKELPPDAFGPMAMPPRTDDGHSLRDNLRKARDLLAQAGWNYRDGALRNAKGESFVIELLGTPEEKVETTTAAWARALEKLGIEMRFRVVDWALYQERLDAHQFEVVFIAFPGTHFPGSEYVDYMGSKAADVDGSGNFAGIKDPVIDDLLVHLTTATNRDDWLAACRAIDRVVADEHYFVPGWTSRGTRVVYDQWHLARPDAVPPYPPDGVPYMDWPMTVWWAKK